MVISGDYSNNGQQAAWFNYNTGRIFTLSNSIAPSPSTAFGSNSKGLLIGSFYSSSGQRAYSYNMASNVFRPLQQTIPGASAAISINNRGDIVGIINNNPNSGYCIGCPVQAFNFYPTAINEHRDIVGNRYTSVVPSAKLLQDGVEIDLNTRLLLTSTYTEAVGINDKRQIIINSYKYVPALGAYRMKSYISNSALTSVSIIGLGQPTRFSVRANGINNCSEIIGTRDDEVNPSSQREPFVWTASRGLRLIDELVAPDATLASWNYLSSINNSGVILAHNSNGKKYLLIPNTSSRARCTVSKTFG